MGTPGLHTQVMGSKQALQGEGGSWQISLLPDPDQGSPFCTGNRSAQLLHPTRHTRPCTAHLFVLGTTAKPLSPLPSPSTSSGQGTTAREFLWDSPSLPPAKQILLAHPLFSPSWCVGWENHAFCIFSIILRGRDEHLQPHCCHSATSVYVVLAFSCFSLPHWQDPCMPWHRGGTAFPSPVLHPNYVSHVTWALLREGSLGQKIQTNTSKRHPKSAALLWGKNDLKPLD